MYKVKKEKQEHDKTKIKCHDNQLAANVPECHRDIVADNSHTSTLRERERETMDGADMTHMKETVCSLHSDDMIRW